MKERSMKANMRNHTMRLVLGLLAFGLFMTSAPVFAQGSRAREKQAIQARQAAVEMQARQTIDGLFNRLCPGRCELVELSVKMGEPQNVGAVAPGFESVAPQAFAVEAASIDATVLLDSKLPSNFRSNIPRMIEYQLRGLAPQINVRPEQLDFPEPQLQPMPPAMVDPPRPAPQAAPAPEPRPATEPVPVAEPDDEGKAAQKVDDATSEESLLEAVAPWIGPLVMVVVLFVMVLILLGRMREFMRMNAGGEGAPTGDGRREPPVDVDALADTLHGSRAVRNHVLRAWIDDDAEAVAKLVSLVGPEILVDLKADSKLRGKLETVSTYVAQQREPLGPDDKRKLVNEANARINAARVTLDDAGMALDWEFLEGLNVNALRSILQSCTTAEKVFVVSQLPTALRSSYLEGIDSRERRELFLGTTDDTLGKQDAQALAARLRKAAEEVAHIGSEADGQAALVIDMLETLPLIDQEEVLRELKSTRSDVAQVVLDRICLETTTMHVPGELLADAIHRTSVDTLSGFLRGTRDDVRNHLVKVAPASKRSAILAELELDIAVGKAEFLDARSSFLSTLRDVLRRDGQDLARANLRAIMGESTINPVSSEATS
jgi:hypothetical protein